MTGGQIQRVDPENLTSNFDDILSKPTLATKLMLKVKLHQGLEFRNEDATNLNEDKTILTKNFGNVNEDTDITFEYRMKKISDLLKLKDIDFSKLQELPFQAQIHFTALDGSRCVRVITKQLIISHDRKEVEKDANFEILGMNAIQKSAKLARMGEFKKAQINAKAWHNRMSQAA